MRIIKTTEKVQAHCHGCDSNVRVVVEVVDDMFMCIDCMSESMTYLLKAGSFFDHFSFIGELATNLSMELGKLQRKDGTQTREDCEAAYVMSMLAHSLSEAAGTAAQIANGLAGEIGVRRARWALQKDGE